MIHRAGNFCRQINFAGPIGPLIMWKFPISRNLNLISIDMMPTLYEVSAVKCIRKFL